MEEGRKCIFCGNSKLCKEHIFAQWLLKELDIYDKNVSMTHASPIGMTISNRQHPFSKLVNGLVCEECNNGWMSRLESACQHHIINLMNMAEIKEELGFIQGHYDTLARWAFKNVVLLNMATNYRQLVPKNHYTTLYSGSIPKNVFIDLSYCRNNSIIEWRQSPGILTIKDASIPFNPTRESYVITFQIKKLLIKVAYFGSKYNVFYEDEGSIRLFPEFGIYGEFKMFDDIDKFYVNGVFNEYKK